MKILKFGGSSVATPDRVKAVVEILKAYYLNGEKFGVVFSAFGGVTDSLIEMTRLAENADQRYIELFEKFRKRHIDAVKRLIDKKFQKESIALLKENHEDLKKLLYGIYLVGECSKRTLDHVLSFGERNSAFIISGAAKEAGINAEYCDARRLIKTDKNFGRAKVNYSVTYNAISDYFKVHPGVQVITGFIASSDGHCTTTLGRGGSDFTASLFGSALNAECIEIWTDVDGVMTANPQIVKDAFSIGSMTYAEAMEVSHFGAKVIYPPTIKPALDKNIPIYIKNTFNPSFEGTLIAKEANKNDFLVRSISSIGDVALLTVEGSGMFGVPGIAGRVFGILALNEINIILITQASSEHSITFAVEPNVAGVAKEVIENEFVRELERGVLDPVKVESDLSLLAVVGENMRFQRGIAGKTFNALGQSGVNIVAIAQGSSELNISIAIKKEDEKIALNSLHKAFFENGARKVFLFIVGIGLVGKKLIEQILDNRERLKSENGIELVIAGVANSKKSYVNDKGLNGKYERILNSDGEKMVMANFIEKMKLTMGGAKIFIDSTASENTVPFYEEILNSGIAISTPNKRAMSGGFTNYCRLKKISKAKNIPFGFETNVGAGLPVINSINDLVNSGDEILKIEGVLSGSLSYIFNNFIEGAKFVEIVKRAKELGFTEPDPRDDLSGTDVKRKLLILAREAGAEVEEENIKIDGLLPKACVKAKTVNKFFKALESENEFFENLISKAKSKNRRLRFIASFEKGKGKIGLVEVGENNPFYNLSGSDNMVVITTKRYFDQPLVIRGSGAGAEVTAAGVFAEIIKISEFITRK